MKKYIALLIVNLTAWVGLFVYLEFQFVALENQQKEIVAAQRKSDMFDDKWRNISVGVFQRLFNENAEILSRIPPARFTDEKLRRPHISEVAETSTDTR